MFGPCKCVCHDHRPENHPDGVCPCVKNENLDHWLAERMTSWIAAIASASTMSWKLTVGQDINPPITAGGSYGFQGLKAILPGRDWLLHVSFGAYQFRWKERTVRVDLYKSIHAVQREDARYEAIFYFSHLLGAEVSWRDPEPIFQQAEPINGLYRMDSWCRGLL